MYLIECKNRRCPTCKAAKMTQEQLAKKVGTDKSYISKVEHGLIVPSIGMFYRMAAAMGYEVELVKRG